MANCVFGVARDEQEPHLWSQQDCFFPQLQSIQLRHDDIADHEVNPAGIVLQNPGRLDEIVGVSFAQNKSHFRVKWVGQADTPRGGHIGLLNLTPDKPLWGFVLPGFELDEFQGRGIERRQNPRLKAKTSVQIYPEGESAIWGTSTDVGVGGCYVEMPIPLKSGTNLKVKLWVGENKLLAGGKVTNSTPGFGFGVQFTEIAGNDLQLLKAFLESITEV